MGQLVPTTQSCRRGNGRQGALSPQCGRRGDRSFRRPGYGIGQRRSRTRLRDGMVQRGGDGVSVWTKPPHYRGGGDLFRTRPVRCARRSVPADAARGAGRGRCANRGLQSRAACHARAQQLRYRGTVPQRAADGRTNEVGGHCSARRNHRLYANAGESMYAGMRRRGKRRRRGARRPAGVQRGIHRTLAMAEEMDAADAGLSAQPSAAPPHAGARRRSGP